MNFVAVDVETANESWSSICQIGMARYENGGLVDTWTSLVDPEDRFNDRNVAVHRITPERVAGAPNFESIAETVHSWLHSATAVCHSAFDRVALRRAFAKIRREPPASNWLDTLRVARRVWSDASSGHRLKILCSHLNYEYRPHEALEDAKACAHVLQQAVKISGIAIDDWLSHARAPIPLEEMPRIGPLSDFAIVFTGKMEMKRRDATRRAAALGARVSESVNERTTHLVCGDQDIRVLNGHEKSAKHRKAEHLIAEGHDLQIVQESDFLEWVNCAHA